VTHTLHCGANGASWCAAPWREPGALIVFFRRSYDTEDGTRLLDSDLDALWLVFGGKRHHLICQQVFNSLFVPNVSLTRTVCSVLHSIPEGPELIFGTSLVRRQGSILVHFFAVHPKTNVLHAVPSEEILSRFGFDITLCRDLPADTFDRIKVGSELC
jgi:hypothetical protein